MKISKAKATEIIKNSQGKFITVVFDKKNGEERVMSGTLNFEHIPTDKQPKGTQHQTSKNTIAVFDVVKENWRSFRVDSVIDFERLTGPGRGSDKKKEVENEI